MRTREGEKARGADARDRSRRRAWARKREGARWRAGDTGDRRRGVDAAAVAAAGKREACRVYKKKGKEAKK